MPSLRLPDLALLVAFCDQRRHLLLLALLTLLQLMLLQGLSDPAARLFFFAHLGLALLWQPFVRPDWRLNPASLALLILFILLSFVGFGASLVAVWVMLLASVIGGKVLLHTARFTRLAYLLALGYLIVLLLVFLIPAIVPYARLEETLSDALAHVALPLTLVVLGLLPADRETLPRIIDPIHGVFIFLMLAVLVLGSLTLLALFGLTYASSLLATLFALGLALLALGWSWATRPGYGGLGGLVSRYVMSIGLPLEQWLHALTELNIREEAPEAFLRAACDEMCQRLPWVLGGDWSTAQSQGQFGQSLGQRSEFRHQDLTLGIRSTHALSPSLVWHFDLLAQLLAEFHQNKQRARALRQLSYLQAIHETGARLTHDIKNLLQALETLCAVAAREGDTPSREFLRLVQCQLPAIYDRLSQTVRKLGGVTTLRTPEAVLSAKTWIAQLTKRYGDQGVELSLTGQGNFATPAWFTNVAENLLDNALAKRRLAPELRIVLELGIDEAGAALLRVSDDGQMFPATLLGELFHGPVPSLTGLGIGLYQSARQAQEAGYRLHLSENRDGAVCFTLSRQSVSP